MSGLEQTQTNPGGLNVHEPWAQALAVPHLLQSHPCRRALQEAGVATTCVLGTGQDLGAWSPSHTPSHASSPAREHGVRDLCLRHLSSAMTKARDAGTGRSSHPQGPRCSFCFQTNPEPSPPQTNRHSSLAPACSQPLQRGQCLGQLLLRQCQGSLIPAPCGTAKPRPRLLSRAQELLAERAALGRHRALGLPGCWG